MVSFRQCAAVFLSSLRRDERGLATLYWPACDRAAEARSLQLLVNNLSPQQRRQFENYRCFDVIGCKTGERYRIRLGRQMNVEPVSRAGRFGHQLCFAPMGGLPVGDVMLAQKIALELFEPDVLRVANKVPRSHANY
jgi:hypothetical protein